ncbi:MAG TPA: type I methionyl aminopeptidase [Pseudonocardiaceae bacterium]
MTRMPDPVTSRAWLIGTSTHADEPDLPWLPSVANNLPDLAGVFTDPRWWGLPAANCVSLLDPKRPIEVIRSLRQTAAAARDTLLIYFSGHGLLGHDGSLFLALNETSSDRELLKYTALAVEDIHNAMRDSPAMNKILILDCCYSGRAIAAMTDTQSAVTAALTIRGAVTLTAAPATKAAIAPPGLRNTAFTGALLTVLRDGLVDGPELLTMDLIYEQVRSHLTAGRYPLPQMQSVNTASRLPLVHNNWWTSRPARPPTVLILDTPPHIRKPAYVGVSGKPSREFPLIQTADTIERMREAGRTAARVLDELSREIHAGVTTVGLDDIARTLIYDRDAYPSTLGYNGYTRSICASVNDVITNGLPNTYRLREGDIVGISLGVYTNGVHAKIARTYPVGRTDEKSDLLIAHAQVALTRAIRSVAPGRQINVIGRAVEATANRGGYGAVRDYTGHGLGKGFIHGPTILNYNNPDDDQELVPGQTFTIHPILTLGSIDYAVDEDNWSTRTKDGGRTAEAMHTILVTETGADILTEAQRG